MYHRPHTEKSTFYRISLAFLHQQKAISGAFKRYYFWLPQLLKLFRHCEDCFRNLLMSSKGPLLRLSALCHFCKGKGKINGPGPLLRFFRYYATFLNFYNRVALLQSLAETRFASIEVSSDFSALCDLSKIFFEK